jgi:hypothetical protein
VAPSVTLEKLRPAPHKGGWGAGIPRSHGETHMFKRARVSLIAVLAFGVTGVAFADTDATPHQIYEAAQAGRLAEAQKMVDQVLLDHPQSATAHFVAAEVDARTSSWPLPSSWIPPSTSPTRGH